MVQFTVVIVEDEPPIARYIMRILEQMGTYKIVAMCEDGFEGIKAVENYYIDVLVTDIQMPGMTGLEVIKKAKELNHKIIPIIISGYKVFEYAQEAIKLDVYEYLIKPLNKEKMKQVFENITETLLQKYKEDVSQTLEQQLRDGQWSEEIQEKYFPYQYFEAIMICCKNLKKSELIREVLKKSADIRTVDKQNVYMMEYKGNLLLLIGTSHYKEFAVYTKPEMNYLIQKSQEQSMNFCGVVTGLEYSTKELINIVKKLNQFLNLHVNYENTGFFTMEGKYAPEVGSEEELDIEQKLLRHLSARMWDAAKKDYIALFMLWEKQKNTQQHIYNKISIILKRVSQLENLEKNIVTVQEEILESIQCANSYGEVMSSIWETIFGTIEKRDVISKKTSKRGMELLYINIIQFIHENIGENLFLTEVCDVFGVSQPYVSKLFRKYANCSYKEYVLKIKIEKAIEMMKKTPDILIKDIAQELGFENPLYFSTVFKNVMKVSPTKYMHEE